MATKRRYDDGCATAHALDLVGERWALLIVRELLFGPKRFTDLRTGMPGASPNVLSNRLRELEEFGVVQRRKLPPPAAAWVYELTEWGRELEPVIISLGRWGGRSPSLRHDAAISVDSLMLALKTLFDPSRTDGFTADVVLRLGEDSFRVQLSADRIWIMRGDLDHPHAVIETDPVTLNALIWGGRGLPEAIEEGEIKLTGSRERVERFLGLFPLPEPAVVARPTPK
ncbi:transcriptional regulator [Jiangella aurantiaca]|uniref:Transcriptional regulator n=1 Tax=Jiangella aurantiaca TaxID=2530373 RepID=A0A4R5A4V9_9ACTN|nr:winged helix-turn-helix transcriptional regulator [Jiangella aurantiaca]TDD64542.1 transcriptional regulator [Jiangella aurantiaca]